MTNTEIWLDEIISHIQSVKSDMWMLREIISLPNCNDCKNKDCEYKPKWGEHIRYNCPLHTDRNTENCSEKPNNSTTEDCSTVWTKENCKGCKYNEYPYDSGTCFVRVCINGNKYEPKDEPQTEPLQTCSVNGRPYSECSSCEHFKCTADEPQMERYCTNCKHNGVIEDYECRECNGMDNHEFIEPQTERSDDAE